MSTPAWTYECVCHRGVLCGTSDYTRCFSCGWNADVEEARKQALREKMQIKKSGRE